MISKDSPGGAMTIGARRPGWLASMPVVLLVCLITVFSTTGCSASKQRLMHAQQIAQAGSLEPISVSAGDFKLAGWLRITESSNSLRVYIEGDGLAWARRDRPSLDPTPRNPVALSLAANDNHPNVLYLARPCQYQGVGSNRACKPALWTHGRFSPEVVDALDQALDQMLDQFREHAGIELVGYSGGGALAVMIAARREDVINLRTVAGNLDSESFVALHQVSPMSGSKNPADYAASLRHLPQVHFFGDADKVIPGKISQQFAEKAAPSTCITRKPVHGANHADGWQERWPTLLALKPSCNARPINLPQGPVQP